MMDTVGNKRDGAGRSPRIGEHFVASGLITEANLQQGLKRQGQAGGRLGSNLIEMGFIGVDDLLGYLDVIVVGEMRDRETFEIALQAATSGHLVISTVHSDNATSIIERIINMFETHEQAVIRMMLADSFLLSIAQRLIPRKDRQARILAVEKLSNSSRVKKMIREGKTHQIRSQMQIGGEDFVPIDISLAEIYKRGVIEFEDGFLYAEDETLYRDMVNA